MIPGDQGSIGAIHHVLAIAGSLRQRSYNKMLLQTARTVSPPEVDLELYADLASIPLFDEDLERQTGGGPPPVKRLRAKVKAADGLLISTPEYNQSMPGVLKNAIDWLSRPGPEEVLIEKPVAIVGASGGRWGTRLAQANLRQVLTATESLVMPQPAIFVAESAKVFGDDGALTNDLLRKQLENFLRAFADWLRLLDKRSLPKAE